ncbi:MAG: aminomethyl-transferring glycine dehydrogenase subunit GcvPB [Candidatus Methylomirabilis sp.]|nr:aminomethyl-transferring glycine dehydrogenase subunit GcvPB [Deltaproteobacteria bacterium]
MRGLVLDEGLVFGRGHGAPEGGAGYVSPAEEDAAGAIPAELLRTDIEGFPDLSELAVLRHFTRLSTWNYGIEHGAYMLGSCTMKYNPKINEDAALLPGFAGAHPLLPEEFCQGSLEVMASLEEWLGEITGMDAVTLQPAAGSHGELTGIMLIRAYHLDRGERRPIVLVPNSAHGTNPASAAIANCEVREIVVGPTGVLTKDRVVEAAEKCGPENVAALMLTNPSTLGLFEEHIAEIAEYLHGIGALVYCDGANLNALLGLARPGDMGFDVIQMNLHKTFSTPHGGGGPGSGPVAVRKILEPFLPFPTLERRKSGIALVHDRPKSIGRMRAFAGHFGMFVRAYAYIRRMGCEDLRRAALYSLLNANYMRAKLRGHYHIPYDRPCMHEVIVNDKLLGKEGKHTADIAKRLIDYGFHPPTVYFPLVVPGALMIEPTETESVAEMDAFVEAMVAIAKEVRETPDVVHDAPHSTRLRRLDETRAARKPILRWTPPEVPAAAE